VFLDGYFSTVQGLLDWFEVDLVFPELDFFQIDLCTVCFLFLCLYWCVRVATARCESNSSHTPFIELFSHVVHTEAGRRAGEGRRWEEEEEGRAARNWVEIDLDDQVIVEYEYTHTHISTRIHIYTHTHTHVHDIFTFVCIYTY